MSWRMCPSLNESVCLSCWSNMLWMVMKLSSKATTYGKHTAAPITLSDQLTGARWDTPSALANIPGGGREMNRKPPWKDRHSSRNTPRLGSTMFMQFKSIWLRLFEYHTECNWTGLNVLWNMIQLFVLLRSRHVLEDRFKNYKNNRFRIRVLLKLRLAHYELMLFHCVVQTQLDSSRICWFSFSWK